MRPGYLLVGLTSRLDPLFASAGPLGVRPRRGDSMEENNPANVANHATFVITECLDCGAQEVGNGDKLDECWGPFMQWHEIRGCNNFCEPGQHDADCPFDHSPEWIVDEGQASKVPRFFDAEGRPIADPRGP